DTTGESHWWNAVTQQSSPVQPLAHKRGLVGSRVLVYWPAEGTSFSGVLTRFNARRGKHRVEYDDGEHEWIELEEQQVRLPFSV
ncbi:unnamed protein product, partial [Phaeothamnion confervicola]